MRDVVEITSTERERSFRAPALETCVLGRRRKAALATLIGAVVFLAVVGTFCVFSSRWMSRSLDAEIFGLVVIASALGFGIKHQAKRWRAKRHARLQLKMERWLASADSCKVGPREWTK